MRPGLSVQTSGRYVNNVQQMVKELNVTASDDKVTILKIVMSILPMKQNRYWSS
jgi:predicted ATPase